ncbi:hypothetical protein ElyMa_003754000 [Elysia marginata]|uniref:Uncharacterized protein n=1 Tax=Elysia marginata TaxID=1093978 RepID=A0AAV4FA41_9GAST|nr:hypothetical protein ElyMa_003754000 [Elysia marginata]
MVLFLGIKRQLAVLRERVLDLQLQRNTPSSAFCRLVPRPASPPPLLLASGSGLAQPSLPFVTSVVLRYSVPLPIPNTHAHHVLRCVHDWTYLGPAAILVSSPLALPRSHILLRHTHRHTRTSANKHRNKDKGLE